MSVDSGYQPWYKEDPELFQKQSEILNAAGFKLNSDAFSSGQVRFDGQSKADPKRSLTVIFPDAFPSRAPQIFSPANQLLARHHRPDTGQLCLFSFNENNWSATLSVEAALIEAESLVAEFATKQTIPANEVPEPLTAVIPYAPAAVLVPPEISTFNKFDQLQSASGKFTIKFDNQAKFQREINGRGIIRQAIFGNEKISSSEAFSGYFANVGKEHQGDWFYLNECPSYHSLNSILEKCLAQARISKRSDFYWIALIFPEEAGRADQRHLTWLVIRVHAKTAGKFDCIRTFPYVQHQRYVRIPGLDGLEQKRVTIVGCGSLGSKIAVNLAASGLNRFVLVDYDYYEPNNSVRHEVGVEWFGLNKETALLERICSLNPAARPQSRGFRFHVGATNSINDEQQFYNLISESDLIIDTTGIHSVSHFLNRISCRLKIPAMYASVTNGAWSGEIVRSIPGKTACWTCWLDQYYAEMPPAAPESSSDLFAPGCNQPTFTGTTHELGIVASLATSTAIETLLSRNDLLNTSKNYIQWCGKDKDGKPILETKILAIERREGCCYCGGL